MCDSCVREHIEKHPDQNDPKQCSRCLLLGRPRHYESAHTGFETACTKCNCGEWDPMPKVKKR